LKIKRNLTILLICFLITMVLATIAQAQVDTVDESDVPDWAKDWADFIPVLGPTIVAWGLLLCCALFLIPLVIAILICIWLYRDAEKRGKQGVLWVLLLILATIFLNIIGLIIVIIVWLIVRPPIKG